MRSPRLAQEVQRLSGKITLEGLLQEGFAPTAFHSDHKLSDRDNFDGGDSESKEAEQDPNARTNQDPDKRKYIVPTSGIYYKNKR